MKNEIGFWNWNQSFVRMLWFKSFGNEQWEFAFTKSFYAGTVDCHRATLVWRVHQLLNIGFSLVVLAVDWLKLNVVTWPPFLDCWLEFNFTIFWYHTNALRITEFLETSFCTREGFGSRTKLVKKTLFLPMVFRCILEHLSGNFIYQKYQTWKWVLRVYFTLSRKVDITIEFSCTIFARFVWLYSLLEMFIELIFFHQASSRKHFFVPNSIHFVHMSDWYTYCFDANFLVNSSVLFKSILGFTWLHQDAFVILFIAIQKSLLNSAELLLKSVRGF